MAKNYLKEGKMIIGNEFSNFEASSNNIKSIVEFLHLKIKNSVKELFSIHGVIFC